MGDPVRVNNLLGPIRGKTTMNLPPWLANMYGTGVMSRAQGRSMMLPRIGMDLAGLLGPQASAQAPQMPLLNLLLRR